MIKPIVILNLLMSVASSAFAQKEFNDLGLSLERTQDYKSSNTTKISVSGFITDRSSNDYSSYTLQLKLDEEVIASIKAKKDGEIRAEIDLLTVSELSRLHYKIKRKKNTVEKLDTESFIGICPEGEACAILLGIHAACRKQ